MASIVVAGPDQALLEGISQTLIAAGHQVLIAHDVPEALDLLQGGHPLVAIIHRDELIRSGVAFRATLATGGAVIAFDSDEGDNEKLPYALKRAILAELRLPLERQRLLALVRSLEMRAQAAGREDGHSKSAESNPG